MCSGVFFSGVKQSGLSCVLGSSSVGSSSQDLVVFWGLLQWGQAVRTELCSGVFFKGVKQSGLSCVLGSSSVESSSQDLVVFLGLLQWSQAVRT